jgi:hypothetical protein
MIDIESFCNAFVLFVSIDISITGKIVKGEVQFPLGWRISKVLNILTI